MTGRFAGRKGPMNGLNRPFSKLCLLLAAVLLIQGVPAQAAESSEEMHLAVEAATMPAGVEEWQMLLVNASDITFQGNVQMPK